jgi:DNA repair protein RadC
METLIHYERKSREAVMDDGCSVVREKPGIDTQDAPLRPRERLTALGPAALSDQELLAVVLNAGIRGKSVTMLAAELADQLDTERGIPDIKDLRRLGGLGNAKACAVSAMLEFGRRRWGPCGSRIGTPSDAYPLIRHFADRRQERFICLSLNGAHETLAVRVVTVGLVNRTYIHPREVFADPIVDRASSVIVAHNHPSGRLEPSLEDEEITQRLKTTGDLLGITLLDHLIFSEHAYFSFLQAGKLS